MFAYYRSSGIGFDRNAKHFVKPPIVPIQACAGVQDMAVEIEGGIIVCVFAG
jgi:hypothetical protein